ncbi:hypothetical protein U0C82_15620 [Fulvimarina sp. 2208YS6-2-32]|uniref:Uncharacterized protein n=1 Tax=Fulvimarina uroteuthidis TaxID=3098149 RepID=A0ABU5I8I3_9HYPH|nr:hypothetical protein [Fulvimarina sp. 2208YS6-2-32]MDY8110571.1 hypothetical protein [Fulvimarina sp. 2208YS6-2-32]
MRRHRPVLAASLTALGLALQPALAQAPSGPGAPAVMEEQLLSEEAQTLLPDAEASEIEDADAIVSDLVDVSLGDWKVRTTLADGLSLSVSDVPLTIALPPELASEVCPIREQDLDQQETVAAVRTCAAKSVNPDLIEAVRLSHEEIQRDMTDSDREADGQSRADDASAEPAGPAGGMDADTGN